MAQNNYYANKSWIPRNNLTTVNLFKNKDSYTKFYNTGDLTKSQSYNRNDIKGILRNYINNNRQLFDNSIIQVCYISDIGLHYIHEAVINNTINMSDNTLEKLMVDPISKYSYAGEDISMFNNTSKIYGVVLEILKLPKEKKIKEKKKVPNKIKSSAPILEFNEDEDGWQ